MDPSLKIHRALLDAGLPSAVDNIKNPTEEYIVNLLTTFLSHFHIDINLIDQPIPEQLTTMIYSEDCDVTNLINLHAVITQIFDKIFVHDFCLTDITSPGQKRFRKQVKRLSNFVLYAIKKKSEINSRMEEIQARVKLLEDLKERKARVSEAIKNKVLHKAKQLSLIEKTEDEIRRIQTRAGKINKMELELEVKKQIAEKQNRKAKELCGSAKTAAGKLAKKIAEVQSEVVHSPEEYLSRLDEIEKQHKLKVDERSMMQEAIQEKKQSLKQIEEKLNFVKKMTDDFRILGDVYEEQKDKKTRLSNITKKIDSLNIISNESKTKLAMQKDQVDTEKKTLQSYHAENMEPLRNIHSQLLSEKKIQQAKLDKSRDCFNEKCLERDRLKAEIKKTEEETVAFMNRYQETYDNEVAAELELRKNFPAE